MDQNSIELVTNNQPTAPKLDTIKNILERLHANGYPVSEAALRGWVRSGKIRRIPIGKKSLVFFQDVIDFLEEYPSSTNTVSV